MPSVARREMLGWLSFGACGFWANTQFAHSAEASSLQRVAGYAQEAISVFGLPTASISFGDDASQSVASLVPDCRRGGFSLFYSSSTFAALESDFGESAVRFIVYHEVSHAFQMLVDQTLLQARCGGTAEPVRKYELMADCGAGYVFAQLFRQLDYTGAPMVIAQLSDYDFSNVTHHGFVSERASAFGLGGALQKAGKRFDMRRLMDNADLFERSLFLAPGFLNKSQEDIERAQAQILAELAG